MWGVENDPNSGGRQVRREALSSAGKLVPMVFPGPGRLLVPALVFLVACGLDGLLRTVVPY